MASSRIRKRAGFESEEFGFYHGFRQSCKGNSSERAVRAPPAGVNRTCNQFFAGSRFPAKKYGHLSILGSSLNHLLDSPESWTYSNDFARFNKSNIRLQLKNPPRQRRAINHRR